MHQQCRSETRFRQISDLGPPQPRASRSSLRCGVSASGFVVIVKRISPDPYCSSKGHDVVSGVGGGSAAGFSSVLVWVVLHAAS